jgi:hypothetical protein
MFKNEEIKKIYGNDRRYKEYLEEKQNKKIEKNYKKKK